MIYLRWISHDQFCIISIPIWGENKLKAPKGVKESQEQNDWGGKNKNDSQGSKWGYGVGYFGANYWMGFVGFRVLCFTTKKIEICDSRES